MTTSYISEKKVFPPLEVEDEDEDKDDKSYEGFQIFSSGKSDGWWQFACGDVYF